MYRQFVVAAIAAISLPSLKTASAQQLTKDMVDNMLKMCSTGPEIREEYKADLKGDIDILRRLGIVGGEASGSGRKTTSEISKIIETIPDPRIKIDALRAIQDCNFRYLELLQKNEGLHRSCVADREKEIKQTHVIEAKNDARCEGGGPFGRGQHRDSSVDLVAPPGFEIVGSADPSVNSENRGHMGAVAYKKDDTGKPTEAHLPISCDSPGQPFGPGAWIDVTLRATIEHIPTSTEIAQIQLSCGG